MADKYGNDSISEITGADQVRLKPSVIFGVGDDNGAAHSVKEIIANSIDEARAGYCDHITVSFGSDGDIAVIDNGRGVPMDYSPSNKKFNWELVFCTLYASGKGKNSDYVASLGTNGLGATATQYASEYMRVRSVRDGNCYEMEFAKGNPVGQLKITPAPGVPTGTEIHFKPDPEVFTGIKDGIKDAQYFGEILNRQAMLHNGLKIDFEHYEIDHKVTFYYKNGISDYLDLICVKPLFDKSVTFSDSNMIANEELDTTPYKFFEKICFNFSKLTSTSDSSAEDDERCKFIEVYHNGSHLVDGGTTLDGFEDGATAAFEHIAQEMGKLKRTEKLKTSDVTDTIFCICDTGANSHYTMFKNQTKTAVANKAFKKEFGQFVYNNIRMWAMNNKDDAEKAVTQIIAVKEIREKASDVSKNVIKSLSKGIKGIGNKPKKFIDCTSNNILERELWIVEGDSAAGAIRLSRDAKTQALIPIRGKIRNLLKSDLGKALSSDIVVDLLRVMGCGIEARSKYIKDLPPFNLAALRWGKIVICTDADVDGYQIRCLVLSLLYTLCPSLIRAGRVYIAETPLFEVIHKKETHFAYNEDEKDKILETLRKQGANMNTIKINRNKGLGETDPDVLNRSTLSPVSRRLIQVVYPQNEEMVHPIFEALLGYDIESRRELIEQYFSQTREMD